MRLFHNTTAESADSIMSEGFAGGSVDTGEAGLVYFADKPLSGFGTAWIVIDIDDPQDGGFKKDNDDEIYRCHTFALNAVAVNALRLEYWQSGNGRWTGYDEDYNEIVVAEYQRHN